MSKIYSLTHARPPTEVTELPTFLRFLADHRWLMLCGLASECFYAFYLVRQFPLVHHEQELVDMGYLNGYSHTGFLTFWMCFSFLFALFLLAWHEASRRQSRATLWLVMGFGSLFALTNVFVYPMNAIDIYGYIAESVELVYYHANPLVTAASQYASDPLIHVAGSFVSIPAPYGPLGIVIDAIPTFFAGHSPLANMLLLKSLFAGCLLIEAYLLYRILVRFRPELAAAGALALAWNPYVLLEAVVNSHNDIVMMLFILLAVYAAIEDRHALAFLCVLLSAFIKYSSLPLIPLFLVYALTYQTTMAQRLAYLLRIGITTIVIVSTLLLPFWTGAQTLASVLSLSQYRLYSFSMLLSDLMSLSIGQSQAVGYILFSGCYLYALWQVIRRQCNLFFACFLTMFALLAFAVNYVQVWYLLCPCMLALLMPRLRMYGVVVLLSYAATIGELVHAYIWPWGAYQNASTYALVNSIVYLGLFWPSLMLLVLYKLNDIALKLK
jgi:hypothetical protein